jgi:hypothetical protein
MTASTEVAERDDAGTLEVLPPRQAPAIAAQQMLRAHAQMMSDAYELACKMVCTTMVPTRFFRKEEDATAAILYGAELGLNPIQSLQRVIPIHGMPSIEGRTMMALLKSRGYRFNWLEKSDTRCVLEGWSPDGSAHETSEWTIERATLAEYVPTKDAQGKWKTNANGKLLGNMKYITDPQAMLKAKCQAEVCRDLAPEILMGISYTTEELESENWDGPVIERAPAASAPITVDEIMGAPDPQPSAATKPKRDYPSGTRKRKSEPVDADVVADPEPTPDPEPVDAPSDPGSKPETPQIEEPAADEAADVRNRAIRKLFALLAKAEITERDDRLVIYRRILKRPEVSSTNDLATNDLEFITQGLEVLDKRGDLAQWCDSALADEAEAQAQADTEGK